MGLLIALDMMSSTNPKPFRYLDGERETSTPRIRSAQRGVPRRATGLPDVSVSLFGYSVYTR